MARLPWVFYFLFVRRKLCSLVDNDIFYLYTIQLSSSRHRNGTRYNGPGEEGKVSNNIGNGQRKGVDMQRLTQNIRYKMK